MSIYVVIDHQYRINFLTRKSHDAKRSHISFFCLFLVSLSDQLKFRLLDTKICMEIAVGIDGRQLQTHCSFGSSLAAAARTQQLVDTVDETIFEDILV